jgi:hypothetical protein
MSTIGKHWKALAAAGVAAAALVTGGVAATAGTGTVTETGPSHTAPSTGSRGIDGFGLTRGAVTGHTRTFTYDRGFYCDTSVSSKAATGCEVGAKYTKAPAKTFDPLYITVPLGFTVPAMKMDCPAGLVCVDHPPTADLTRLEPALKPLYPKLTDAQLTTALENAEVPGHNHFLADLNGTKPEWWDVQVVGVTSPKVYADISAHHSLTYLKRQFGKNKNVVGPLPSNIFLYFAAK